MLKGIIKFANKEYDSIEGVLILKLSHVIHLYLIPFYFIPHNSIYYFLLYLKHDLLHCLTLH
jgi:hypothetical protein